MVDYLGNIYLEETDLYTILHIHKLWDVFYGIYESIIVKFLQTKDHTFHELMDSHELFRTFMEDAYDEVDMVATILNNGEKDPHTYYNPLPNENIVEVLKFQFSSKEKEKFFLFIFTHLKKYNMSLNELYVKLTEYSMEVL